MPGAGSAFGRPGVTLDRVIKVGGGGGVAAVAALVGEPGDTISNGEDTWIEGIGVWRNTSGAPLNIPNPATEANLIATGFIRDTENMAPPPPRVVSSSDVISEGEHVVGSGNAPITLTLGVGAKYVWVSRSISMEHDVDVVSAGAPTITIEGDPTGVRLNEAYGPVLFILDPDNSSNYLAVVPGASSASGGTPQGQSDPLIYTTTGW